MSEIPADVLPFLDQAQAIHRKIPVAAPYFEYYGYDSLFAETGAAQCDLEKMDAAGMRALGIALANGGASYFEIGPNEFLPAGDADWAFENLLRNFDTALATIEKCPRVRVVGRASELTPDPADPAIYVLPLVTSHTWMKDLAAVDAMFARGLRISHCGGVICHTWNRPAPSTKVHGKEGPMMTDFGREVVARMNELGMILDMAHVSDESTAEIIKASSKPVIDGHTGSTSKVPKCRGHNDATLKLIADSGGVAGIHFADHLYCVRVWEKKYAPAIGTDSKANWAYNRHLLEKYPAASDRARMRKNSAEREKFFRDNNLTAPPRGSSERIATVRDMADHIDHLVNVMGIEHVGLGGDVNGITSHSWPAGVDHVGDLPVLTAELLRRGWSEDATVKFLSANWLRVFRECLPD